MINANTAQTNAKNAQKQNWVKSRGLLLSKANMWEKKGIFLDRLRLQIALLQIGLTPCRSFATLTGDERELVVFFQIGFACRSRCCRSFHCRSLRFARCRSLALLAVEYSLLVSRRSAPIYHLQGASPIYSPQGNLIYCSSLQAQSADLPSTGHQPIIL